MGSTDPDPKEHPLATTQALAAFAVAALFWGLGVTLIDPREGVGIALCAVGIAATLWIFWNPILRIPNTTIVHWPWLGIILVLIEIAIPSYLLIQKPIEEDVRASFFIDGDLPRLLVRAEITNPGKFGSVVTSFSLFEIVAMQPSRDPQENANLCDKVSPSILPAIQMGEMVMGRGAQVGGSAQRHSVYSPQKISLNGAALDIKSLIPVESGKIQQVLASFELSPDHWKDFDTLVVCPMISIRDVKGNTSVSICKGASFSYGLKPNLSTEHLSTNDWQQRRLLPHSNKLPTCPPS